MFNTFLMHQSIARLKVAGDTTWTANNATLSAEDSNIVAYWKLEDVNDAVNSYNLTNNNTATFASGKYNNGVQLTSSSSQYLSYADDAAWDFGTNDFTIAGWFKWDSSPGVATLASHGGNGASSDNAGWNIYSESSNRIDWYVKSDSATFVVQIDATGLTINTATWYHFAFERNGSTFTVYQNGSSVGTDTYAGTVSYGTDELRIGTTHDAGRFFDGMVDELCIWDGTSGIVTELYNSGTGAFYTG